MRRQKAASIGCTRDYYECDDFVRDADFSGKDVRWCCTDQLDKMHMGIRCSPQLYNIDAVAYESIMLGLFEIHYGHENAYSEASGIPKITELIPMYSRDGFHFSRPRREPSIRSGFSEGKYDTWDLGYIQSVGGICIINGDELWIYYSGVSGDKSRTPYNDSFRNGMYSGTSVGLAKLRRDGFVSKNNESGGTLMTRKLTFFDK